MKQPLLVILIITQTLTAAAQQKTPKWMEKASKAVFTVEVTTADGTKKTGSGFFLHENGEAVAPYALFKQANAATVTTAGGETLQVLQILGADAMYDVVRFKVAAPKKTPFLSVAAVAPTLNSTAILPPAPNSKPSPNSIKQGAVSEITKIKNAYDYYKIDMPLPNDMAGCPLLNEAGEVFALAQADASGKGKTYGLSVAFIQSLQATATDMFNRAYSEIGLRTAWAQDPDEARISLALYASRQDPPTYLETLNDFIATFPANAAGYVSRASHYAHHRKTLAATDAEQLQMLDLAWNDLEKSAKYTPKRGDVYYNQAKLIFEISASDSLLQYKNWNVKTASALLQKAIAEDDQPAYRLLEGDIALNQKNYEQAYQSYSIVNRSDIASGVSFYIAAKCKQELDASNLTEIIALLDSAVNRSQAGEAAAYLLENVELKMQAELYAEAVKDYDKYYSAVGNVNDGFYYYREQAKFRAGDLDGALTDINKALLMNDKDAIYHAEKASVCLRLRDLAQAQASAQKAIELQPDFASAYRILGVSLSRQDKKTEACEQFRKAKEMGDPLAEKLINDNCK